MTFLNKQLYALMKDDVASTKAWFEQHSLNSTDYHDVIAFRVGHVLGNKVSEDAIKSDIVRNLCEFESVVHFVKITKRLERPHNTDSAPYNTMTYSYRADNRTAPKLISDTNAYFEQSEFCKYMPTDVTVASSDPRNPFTVDVHLGKNTSGKHVCDVIDAAGLSIQSNLKGLSQEYEENKISLPVISQIEPVPDYVVKSLSLLASVADGNYRYKDTNRAFNGIIVTPTIVMYSRLVNLYNTVINY